MLLIEAHCNNPPWMSGTVMFLIVAHFNGLMNGAVMFLIEELPSRNASNRGAL